MRLLILLSLVAAAAATAKQDRCREPKKSGPCEAAITRWYFSAKAGKCLKFIWGGCQANGNNFKTLAACNKWCNPCLEPRKVGPCYARIPRWFFSVKQNKCLRFFWGGCQANGNNFKTLKACRKQCCRRGCGNPCRQPRKVGPCRASIPRWYYSTKSGKCLKFSWGGCEPNGNNFKTLAACNKQCNPCAQPRKVGPCKARIPRWFFSVKRNRCLPFFWGGCKANGNNFRTLKACSRRCCSRGCGDPCRQPLKVGPCRAAIPRWYFSTKAGKCLFFRWGGCQPNGNNFKTLAACQKRCCRGRYCGYKKPHPGRPQPCRGRYCGYRRPKFCYLPAVTGRCRAYFERFFFDGKKCRKFIYGGCGGNRNNFKTIGECKKVCKA